MTLGADRDPIDQEIERMLTAHPRMLAELQEYDRRAEQGEDLGEFLSSDELRQRIGLPLSQPPA